MTKRSALLLSAAALLSGCGDATHEGGGFETPDIQARVTTPQGAPAAGARVWLVASRGDTAPAQVVDSTLSDSNGIARFRGQPTDHEIYGIDARSSGWMGMAPGSLARSDSVTLRLADTGNLAVASDSSGIRPQLYVPGSHFGSHRSSDGTREILPLPRGTWSVAVKTPGKLVVWNNLKVDSTLVVLPRDSLPDGPRMDLDSFLVDGLAMYARSLPPVYNWTTLTGTKGGSQFVPSTVSEDTGRIAFHIGGDTGAAHRASGVRQLLSSAQGTFGLAFDAWDSTLWPQTGRTLSLLDSSRNGVVLDIDSISDRSMNDLLKVSDTGTLSVPADTAMIQPSGWNTTQVRGWFFTWTGTRIILRNSAGWSATVARTFKTAPTLTIEMRTSSSTPYKVHLLEARFYSTR